MSEIREEDYDLEFKDAYTRSKEILKNLESKDTDKEKIRELMYHLASAEMRGIRYNLD